MNSASERPCGRHSLARLSGTGLIADDVYLVAHDDVTGRSFLQARALGIGLSGGLLAELAMREAIRVQSDRIAILGLGQHADGLARSVLKVLASEQGQHSVRDWLMYLAAAAEGNVARRLASSGYLIQTQPRRPWRPARWTPANSDEAFAALIRVRTALDLASTPSMSDIVLAGLAAACGLGPRILPYGGPGARQRLDAAVSRLPADLRELVAQTQAAVDIALLSHRI